MIFIERNPLKIVYDNLGDFLHSSIEYNISEHLIDIIEMEVLSYYNSVRICREYIMFDNDFYQ